MSILRPSIFKGRHRFITGDARALEVGRLQPLSSCTQAKTDRDRTMSRKGPVGSKREGGGRRKRRNRELCKSQKDRRPVCPTEGDKGFVTMASWDQRVVGKGVRTISKESSWIDSSTNASGDSTAPQWIYFQGMTLHRKWPVNGFDQWPMKDPIPRDYMNFEG